jgi:hypothetical protein
MTACDSVIFLCRFNCVSLSKIRNVSIRFSPQNTRNRGSHLDHSGLSDTTVTCCLERSGMFDAELNAREHCSTNQRLVRLLKPSKYDCTMPGRLFVLFLQQKLQGPPPRTSAIDIRNPILDSSPSTTLLSQRPVPNYQKFFFSLCTTPHHLCSPRTIPKIGIRVVEQIAKAF